MTASATARSLTLSESVRGLGLLLGRGHEDVFVDLNVANVDGFGVADPYRNSLTVPLRASEFSRSFLPALLVKYLEDEQLALHLRSVVRHSRAPVVNALIATAAADALRVDERPREAFSEFIGNVEDFAVPPTALVFGGFPRGGLGYSLSAVYALDGPFVLHTLDERDQVTALSQRLAARLGGRLPQDLADVVLPIPGSSIRDGKRSDVATCLMLNQCVHSLAGLRSALQEDR